MTSVQNRNRRVVEEAVRAFNAGDLEGFLRMYDEEVALHGFPAGIDDGIEGARAFFTTLRHAFGQAQLEIEDISADDDCVRVRTRMVARHTGSYRGVLPTNQDVAFEVRSSMLFEDGRCVEHWRSWDEAALLEQLGVPTGEGEGKREGKEQPGGEGGAASWT